MFCIFIFYKHILLFFLNTFNSFSVGLIKKKSSNIVIVIIFLSRRLLTSYLLTKYSISLGASLVTMNDLYITPSVLNYFGIILFGLYFMFTMFVLAMMKDRLFEKQSFFNLLFYMTIYLLVYPIVLIIACWHFVRRKMIWR